MKAYLSKDQMMYAEDDNEAVVYIALKVMFDKMLSRNGQDSIEVCLNYKQMYHLLSGTYNMNRYDKAKLEAGLGNLINAGVVNLVDTDGKDEFVLDLMPLQIKSKKNGADDNEPYTMMDLSEIQAIFNIPCKNKFGLLRFAVGLFGTFNNATKCGFCSFRNMPDYTYVSRIASCQEFFKLLEDNGIIYVRHSDHARRDQNGQIKKMANIYGRPEDSQDIDCFFDERVARLGHDFTNTMGSTRKAKLTRNYNKFVAGSYKGNVIELIRECLVFNELPYIQGKPEYEKDLTIFDDEDIKQAHEGLKEHIKKEKKKEAEPKAKPIEEDYEDDYDEEDPY